MDRFLATLCCVAVAVMSLAAAASPLLYPPAPRGSVVDDYFGTKVADPYRWLEEIDSPQTRTWVDSEVALSRSFLDAIPQRNAIHARLTQLWNYERFSVPFHDGPYYFYTHNTGLQNQSVLFVSRSPFAVGRAFLDPNKLSADGTVAVTTYGTPPDGKYLAYSTQTAGSDWQTWHVRNVETGKDLADTIEWSKFSDASWASDDSGFYYSRYAAPSANALKAANYNQTIYFHRLGAPQRTDRLVYARPDHPQWGLGGYVTDDGRYLVVYAFNGTDPHNRIYYRDLRELRSPIRPIFDKGDAAWTYLGNDGARWYFLTDKDAPRGRIVSIDVRHPARLAEIVPQTADKLDAVSLLRDRFIATYLHDARSLVAVYDVRGRRVGSVSLPGIGSAYGFGGRRTSGISFYSFVSFTRPATIFAYDVASGASAVVHAPHLRFDPKLFVTRQVFYRSKDGTRVPMFISYRDGFVPRGDTPTILYGYGGFDISLTPSFSTTALTWMEMGGVYAVANIRGGGEYGETWHRAGMLSNKQNVFDDFIAAAQYLIVNKYTSTPRLAINGGSNGGLLCGAILTQRPDLVGAAVCEVGVLDMLRYQKFTIGNAWSPEYGTADASADQFKTLYAYSPYHNVRDGVEYPPTLVMTADHDDRVFPANSFKFAAALQHAQAGSAPVLIRIEKRAGHGGGIPVAKYIDETTDKLSFLVKELGL